MKQEVTRVFLTKISACEVRLRAANLVLLLDVWYKSEIKCMPANVCISSSLYRLLIIFSNTSGSYIT